MSNRIEVAKILLKNEEGKFLMLRKSGDYDDQYSGHWEQPGGKIEDSENRFEAVKREVKEETGLEIDNSQDVVRLKIESDELIDCYVLSTKDYSGSIELSEEHSEYRWFTEEEFKTADWHCDSGYILPAMEYLESYLNSEKKYGDSGKEIDVVKTLIRNDNGKFLLVRKSDIEKVSSSQNFKKYGEMSGKWELPGGRIGKVEGENRFEAAEREIKEEIGIELTEGKDTVREEIEEINSVNAFILLYEFKNSRGEISLSEEHSNYRWMDPDEYAKCNWHKDAGYGIPPAKFLKHYLEIETCY